MIAEDCSSPSRANEATAIAAKTPTSTQDTAMPLAGESGGVVRGCWLMSTILLSRAVGDECMMDDYCPIFALISEFTHGGAFMASSGK